MEIINIEGHIMPRKWMDYPDYPEPPDDHWMDRSQSVQAIWGRYREIFEEFYKKHSQLENWSPAIPETPNTSNRSEVWKVIFNNLKVIEFYYGDDSDRIDRNSLCTNIENELKQYLK